MVRQEGLDTRDRCITVANDMFCRQPLFVLEHSTFRSSYGSFVRLCLIVQNTCLGFGDHCGHRARFGVVKQTASYTSLRTIQLFFKSSSCRWKDTRSQTLPLRTSSTFQTLRTSLPAAARDPSIPRRNGQTRLSSSLECQELSHVRQPQYSDFAS